MNKKFAIIGVGGYVAHRHLKAIKDTGNTCVAAFDPNDSVGIIDSYFPDSSFFTEFERFDRHLDKLKRKGIGIDFISICSPSYLHDAHIRFGLRHKANVICEKPLVLNSWNLDGLKEHELEYGKKIYSILQLRLHESILRLKKAVASAPPDKIHDLDLTYIASRGNWYYASWKGENPKSGGIATNIGIHFFDMLCSIFGEIKENIVHIHQHDRAAGFIRFSRAKVKWFLSINYDTLPGEIKEKGMRTYRSLKMDKEEFGFSKGFEELHTKSYELILNGNGFGLDEASQGIHLVHDIRNIKPVGLNGEFHPFAKKKISPHPFNE